MHKVTATPNQEQHVRQSAAWNRKWDQSLGGLYFNEELAGPDGMSVQLFATEDTPDLMIQAAEQQAREEGDVVSIHALVVPPEWLEETDDKKPSASIDTLRQIVKEHSAQQLKWKGGEKQLVDVTTANMLVQVYDALRPELQDKVGRMIESSRPEFLKVIDIAWSAVA